MKSFHGQLLLPNQFYDEFYNPDINDTRSQCASVWEKLSELQDSLNKTFNSMFIEMNTLTQSNLLLTQSNLVLTQSNKVLAEKVDKMEKDRNTEKFVKQYHICLADITAKLYKKIWNIVRKENTTYTNKTTFFEMLDDDDNPQEKVTAENSFYAAAAVLGLTPDDMKSLVIVKDNRNCQYHAPLDKCYNYVENSIFPPQFAACRNIVLKIKPHMLK
jgi:deoxyribodipyrimidine photolyase